MNDRINVSLRLKGDREAVLFVLSEALRELKVLGIEVDESRCGVHVGDADFAEWEPILPAREDEDESLPGGAPLSEEDGAFIRQRDYMRERVEAEYSLRSLRRPAVTAFLRPGSPLSELP